MAASNNNSISLEKAHSVATHLARMSKAVEDYNNKVGKLHNVHCDDMQASIQKLHKMVGVTGEEKEKYGEGEPQSADITSLGTPNTIGGFDRTVKSGAKPDAQPQPASTNSQPQSVTLEQIQELITKSVEASMVTLLKGILNKDDSSDDEDEDDKDKEKRAKADAKQKKATGVGDRTQVTPVQTQFPGPGPIRKVDDGATNTQDSKQVAINTDLAKRALEGDSQAMLDFMKVRASEIPNTLIEPLSKIH